MLLTENFSFDMPTTPGQKAWVLGWRFLLSVSALMPNLECSHTPITFTFDKTQHLLSCGDRSNYAARPQKQGGGSVMRDLKRYQSFFVEISRRWRGFAPTSRRRPHW